MVKTGYVVKGLILLSFVASSYSLAQSDMPKKEKETCIASACFTNSSSISSSILTLRGTGLFEYFMFDVYCGAFYSERSIKTIADALSPMEKVLVIEYFRPISKEDLIESSEKLLRNNPDVKLEHIRPELNTLYSMYTDVKKGDQYSIHYQAGKGTTLLLNNVAVGTIAGEEFQKAFFGIWVSEHSVSETFTRNLLGLNKEKS